MKARATPPVSIVALILLMAAEWHSIAASRLSLPEVDSYNIHVGTQTFGALYQFTTNTVLVETAEAIQSTGSDILKFYLGRDTSRQYRIPFPSSVKNLTMLARNEPSYRRVLDMPFCHLLMWAYCLTPGSDTYWLDGMSATERQKEYDEMYALTQHLLTTYEGTGKSFYLGHWEGDWYLLPSYNTATNPTPAKIQGMRDWLNTRQQAVDDANRDTPHTNVHVYAYAEVNRVRDAMLNGANSNKRLVNQVLPAVTNLDFVSWSSYDGQDLSASELTRTLNYIESQLSTNKASAIPGRRVWIGEYGWGGSLTSAQQEPRTRTYLRNLLSWSPRFVLFWEIYNNEKDRAYWLIDSSGQKTPCYYLHARYANLARLSAAQFLQSEGRLPSESEFGSLMSPFLLKPLLAPTSLTISNAAPSTIIDRSASLVGVLVQGVYGEEQARVWLHWGRADGGTNTTGWEHSMDLGLNTRFGPTRFTAGLTDLVPSTKYHFRFRAAHASAENWAVSSSEFQTTSAPPRLNNAGFLNGGYSFVVAGTQPDASNTHYQVQATSTLAPPTQWMTLFSTNAALLPFAWSDSESTSLPQRFYRVLLSP